MMKNVLLKWLLVASTLSLGVVTSAFVVPSPFAVARRTTTTTTELQMIGGMFSGLFGKKDAEVTQTVFFDININDQYAGRIEMGLYGGVVPKTAENFKQVYKRVAPMVVCT